MLALKIPCTSPRPLDFDRLAAAEDRHFWFRSRNRLLKTVIADLVKVFPAGYQVLEVGCGTGYVLRMLEQVCHNGNVAGVDLFEEGIAFARSRVRCPLIKADIQNLPFERPCNLIGLFDVLEHIADDGAALRNLAARLAPGGSLVLTVPAHMSLWSHFDVYSQHYRRYSMASLTNVLKAAGLRVAYMTQFMSALYPAMWLRRKLAVDAEAIKNDPEKTRSQSLKDLQVGTIANTLFGALLAWEPYAVKWRLPIPLGTSILAVAERDDSVATQGKR